MQVLLNPGIWADNVPWCSANNLSGRPEPGVGPDKVGLDVRYLIQPHHIISKSACLIDCLCLSHRIGIGGINGELSAAVQS